MKFLRAVLLVVVVAPALVVVGSTRALACSCVPAQADDVAIEDAAAVFTGTLTDIEDGVDIGFDRVTWTFAVDKVYKNDAVTESQEVTSHTQGPACGLVFKEEKRYAIFAYESRGKLDTNSCSNTRPLAEGKDLKLEPIATFGETEGMGPGGDAAAPNASPEDDGGWDPVAVAVVGLVVVGALVAFAFVIARRRKT